MKFRMPEKNRGFDNEDLGDMFADAELLTGDQGAPPSDDEFGEGELLKGDQNMNIEDDIIVQDEEEDDEADEEDKKFLEEISKPAAKAAEQKLAAAVSKQSAKRETNWAGNGLGSGTLQEQKKKDDAALARKNINMAIQPAKKEAEPKPIPWGWNPLGKTKAEVNAEEAERKRLEAQEKFKDIQHQKKEALKNANPSLNVFMAQMADRDKKGREEAKFDAVNPLIKNAQIKEVNPAAMIKTGSDRVPAEAKAAVDAESTVKLASDLQKELRQLFFENKQNNRQMQQMERRRLTVQSQLDDLMIKRNLVKVNGKLEAKKEFQSTLKRILKSADIPDYDKIAERVNPMEPVVAKFAE